MNLKAKSTDELRAQLDSVNAGLNRAHSKDQHTVLMNMRAALASEIFERALDNADQTGTL